MIHASHHDDVVARVWSLVVGMLGGAAIVGVLLVGHALFFDNGFFDNGRDGIAATGTTVPTSLTTSDPAAVATTTTAGAGATTTPALPTGTVTLLDVFTENDRTIATVMVDADSYNVAAGDTFATDYRVDAITGRCAQLRHGGKTFELCVGASIKT